MVPMWMVILLLGADAPPPLAPPKTACVNADVGNVRVLAGEGEDVIARLRIGTRVFVRETRGEWTRIDAGAAKGWMKNGLLSSDCPALEELVGKSTSATAPADAVRWADRALALDPFAPEAQAAAASAYAKAKIGGVKAIALMELRDGKTAVFLASCRDAEAMLVAQVKPAGLEALLTSTELLPPPSDLAVLLPALSGATWFALAPDGTSARVDGTPFPAPSLATSEGVDGLPRVRLGACSAPGTLYATRALTNVGPVPLREETAARARAAWLDRVGATAATTGTAQAIAPIAFTAELFGGEDVRDGGLGAAAIDTGTPGSAWALLEGTEVAESVSGVSHAVVAAIGNGRRVAVIAHVAPERRFTVLLIAADRSRERIELALESGPSASD